MEEKAGEKGLPRVRGARRVTMSLKPPRSAILRAVSFSFPLVNMFQFTFNKATSSKKESETMKRRRRERKDGGEKGTLLPGAQAFSFSISS